MMTNAIQKIHFRTKTLTVTGLMLALGLILPLLCAHGIGIPGTILLPMHIPVLLGGFLCGPIAGVCLGALLPILNSALTGMPVMFPMVPIMTVELTVYGLAAGLLYRHTPLGKKRWGVYVALPLAMLAGRLVYGLVFQVLLVRIPAFSRVSVWGAVVTGLPGILVQLLLIPAIVTALSSGSYRRRHRAVASAKTLLSEERACCILIRDGVIVRTESGRGIAPILSLHDEGALQDVLVVDKVVGKAAAIVMCEGGVKACVALTMSESALAYFKLRGVAAEYQTLVPYIVNRTGDGACPMETTVRDLTDAAEAIAAVRVKLAELRAK